MAKKALTDGMRAAGVAIDAALTSAGFTGAFVRAADGTIDPVATKRGFIHASRLLLVREGIGNAPQVRADSSIDWPALDQYIGRAMGGRTEAPLAGIAQGAAVAVCMRSGGDSATHLMKIVDAIRKAGMRGGGPWQVVAGSKPAQGATIKQTAAVTALPDTELRTWADICKGPATAPVQAPPVALPAAPPAAAPKAAAPVAGAAANPFDTGKKRK